MTREKNPTGCSNKTKLGAREPATIALAISIFGTSSCWTTALNRSSLVAEVEIERALGHPGALLATSSRRVAAKPRSATCVVRLRGSPQGGRFRAAASGRRGCCRSCSCEIDNYRDSYLFRRRRVSILIRGSSLSADRLRSKLLWQPGAARGGASCRPKYKAPGSSRRGEGGELFGQSIPKTGPDAGEDRRRTAADR